MDGIVDIELEDDRVPAPIKLIERSAPGKISQFFLRDEANDLWVDLGRVPSEITFAVGLNNIVEAAKRKAMGDTAYLADFRNRAASQSL